MSNRIQTEYRILKAHNTTELQKQVMELLESSTSTERWETQGGITFYSGASPYHQVIVRFTVSK